MNSQFKTLVCLGLCLMPLYTHASGLSSFIDVLAWQASEQPTNNWSNAIIKPNSQELVNKVENTSFHWDIGLRGGFSYEPKSDFWDVRFFWTYVPAEASSFMPSGNQIVIPEFFNSFISVLQDIEIFYGGDINWQLRMNTADIQASHAFAVGAFSFRPSIGIKAGTIHQTVQVVWDALIYHAHEKVQNNFYGIGPSFGLESKWHLNRYLTFIGDLSTAFMWGYWKVNDLYTRPVALDGIITPTTITNTMNKAKLGTLMFDYFLGLEYVYKGRSSANFRLGYEMQYWANQLRMPTFQQLPVNGDLTFQGATCRIQIDF